MFPIILIGLGVLAVFAFTSSSSSAATKPPPPRPLPGTGPGLPQPVLQGPVVGPPQPPPRPAVIPAPAIAPPQTNVVTSTLSPVQKAASLMLSALIAHGYKACDQALYKSFQGLAGLSTDGFPGLGTMHALANVLATMGQALPPDLPLYPWTKAGGWGHPNAPDLSEWNGPCI